MPRRRKRDDKKVRSPYVRYGKVPYKYEALSCTHRDASGRPSKKYESGLIWSGWVCTKCNNILTGGGGRHERHT